MPRKKKKPLTDLEKKHLEVEKHLIDGGCYECFRENLDTIFDAEKGLLKRTNKPLYRRRDWIGSIEHILSYLEEAEKLYEWGNENFDNRDHVIEMAFRAGGIWAEFQNRSDTDESFKTHKGRRKGGTKRWREKWPTGKSDNHLDGIEDYYHKLLKADTPKTIAAKRTAAKYGIGLTKFYELRESFSVSK